METDEAPLFPGRQRLREVGVGRRLRDADDQTCQRDQADACDDAPRHRNDRQRQHQAQRESRHRGSWPA